MDNAPLFCSRCKLWLTRKSEYSPRPASWQAARCTVTCTATAARGIFRTRPRSRLALGLMCRIDRPGPREDAWMLHPADNSGVSQHCKNNNTKACNDSSASAMARTSGAHPLYRCSALSTKLLVPICHYRPAAKSLLKTVACAVGFLSSRKHAKNCVVRHTTTMACRRLSFVAMI